LLASGMASNDRLNSMHDAVPRGIAQVLAYALSPPAAERAG